MKMDQCSLINDFMYNFLSHNPFMFFYYKTILKETQFGVIS